MLAEGRIGDGESHGRRIVTLGDAVAVDERGKFVLAVRQPHTCEEPGQSGYGGRIVEDDANLPDAGKRSGLQVGAAYPCGCVVDDHEFGVAVLVAADGDALVG